MPFLPPNQQRQSTEGKTHLNRKKPKKYQHIPVIISVQQHTEIEKPLLHFT